MTENISSSSKTRSETALEYVPRHLRRFSRSEGASARTLFTFARSAASGELLYRPAVAVRIAEKHKRAPGELLDLTDLHAPPDELRMRGVDIGDHHLQPTHGAWNSIREAFSQGDRARRPRRC